MKTTIRVNRITVRTPSAAALGKTDVAGRVAAEIAARSGRPVPPALRRELARKLDSLSGKRA